MNRRGEFEADERLKRNLPLHRRRERRHGAGTVDRRELASSPTFTRARAGAIQSALTQGLALGALVAVGLVGYGAFVLATGAMSRDSCALAEARALIVRARPLLDARRHAIRRRHSPKSETVKP